MSAFTVFILVASVALDPGATLLDLDAAAGRALVGLATPAPVDADPLLLMRVRYLDRGEPQEWPLHDQVLRYAGLLPGGGFIATLANGTLLEVPAGGGPPRRLDTEVMGAVAVSRTGRFVVYCRGQAPELEVWRFDLERGESTPITRDMAPTWSPGVSPDGQTVFFASARSGVPALWRVALGPGPGHGDDPVQLNNLGADPLGMLEPTPEGVTATVVTPDAVIFDGRSGSVRLDWSGAMQETRP